MEEIVIVETPIHLWGIGLGAAIVTAVFVSFSISILKRFVNGNRLVVDLLGSTSKLFVLFLSLYVGSLFLTLPPLLAEWPYRLLVISLAIQGGLWGNELILFLLRRSQILGIEEEAIASGSITVINFVTKTVLWSVVAIFLLSNLGFDVTALLTGLGVGGIAVALAVQNVLGDLFASLSIVIDRPFKIGDFIIVDGFKGHVEHIGLKTTRLRSISGEQLVFSNADLLKSRIRNFKRMRKRRSSFTVGIHMDTPLDKVKKLPQMLREVIDPIEKVSFDRAHFKEIGDFSYNYDVVYYLENPEMSFYLDVQQQINLSMLQRFHDEGIALAYPTQTINLTRETT